MYESKADYDIMLSAYKEGSPLYQYEEIEGKHHLHLTNSDLVGPVIEQFILNSEKFLIKE